MGKARADEGVCYLREIRENTNFESGSKWDPECNHEVVMTEVCWE